MEFLTVNLSGKVRRGVLHGRNYLITDMTTLVPGVLNGSAGALYYPEDEVAKRPGLWNGAPIVNGHPLDGAGRPLSARAPAILEKHGIGFVFNDRFENGARRAEGWFDESRTRTIAPKIYANLTAGRPSELSTGLFTENEPVQNGSHKGKTYTEVARNYIADHLATLEDAVGACSINDGCGVCVINADDALAGSNGAAPEPGSMTKDKPHACTCATVRNNGSGPMPLTTEQRAERVSFIVANCDCYKGKEDVLAKADESLLEATAESVKRSAALATNAAKPGTPTPAPTPSPTPTPTPSPGGTPTPTPGPAKPLTLNEFLASVPAEVAGPLNNLITAGRAEQERLIGIITANSKRFTKEFLATKDIGELEAIAEPYILAANASAARTGQPAPPSYRGAAGAPPTGNAAPEVKPMKRPTYNWGGTPAGATQNAGNGAAQN
jgi:hypothetical protein